MLGSAVAISSEGSELPLPFWPRSVSGFYFRFLRKSRALSPVRRPRGSISKRGHVQTAPAWASPRCSGTVAEMTGGR